VRPPAVGCRWFAGRRRGHPSSMPPNPLSPMLATAGPLPSGPAWVWEWKWDGQRGVSVVDSTSRVKLFSRNGNDISASFPDVAAALSASTAGRSVTLDGELVALDSAGRPDFGLLQRRMHVARPSAALLRSTPVTYFVFDVLDVDGESVRTLPYAQHRALLEGLGVADGRRVQVPPNMTGIDGETLMGIAADNGIEGVVAKKAESVYRSGIRSPSWIKVPIRNTRRGVICGWVPTGGRAGGTLAALLLGAYNEAGELVYIGRVGTGFTDRMRRELRSALADRTRSDSLLHGPIPPADAVGVSWVAPELVATVEYREQSATGRLRHPAFKGIRCDIAPRDVVK
jgi:bifunctional non-homologous end joining protein LigD